MYGRKSNKNAKPTVLTNILHKKGNKVFCIYALPSSSDELQNFVPTLKVTEEAASLLVFILLPFSPYIYIYIYICYVRNQNDFCYLRLSFPSSSSSSSAMMFFHDEAVQFPSCPLLTPSDIEELMSLVQAADPASPSSGSQGSNRAVDERKRRRMLSNRESARRSRWRKKRHLENVTNQVNRLKSENRELKSRLALTLHQHLLVSLENAGLRSESVTLLTRLSDLYRVLGSNTFHSQ
ncbi:basic leucine zipper 4-like [Senna tora]|uniref:Basic leucine zipper 4-like n=1 Tax=Senna tora TaxID=362788 RepID=A0A834TXQ4_9FABA|nr:basic leucine zipper 4-like [Senna tora]